jgi:hypothetical protein
MLRWHSKIPLIFNVLHFWAKTIRNKNATWIEAASDDDRNRKKQKAGPGGILG